MGNKLSKFLTKEIQTTLIDFYKSERPISILTGAGISEASGIPTFRGKDGIWVVGSKNYKPERIATQEMFREDPLEVWKWFLYMKAICENANPNEGHFAIVELEKIFQNRFYLITQNVDGLHNKAGNSAERVFAIHGTLNFTRCEELCTSELFSFPKVRAHKEEKFTDEEIQQLKCPNCGEFTRPSVLLFDEFYNELFYKLDSTLEAIDKSGLLIIVGTSGSTSLPVTILQNSIENNIPILDINIEENYFSDRLDDYEKGFSIQGDSSIILKEIVNLFKLIGLKKL